MASRRPAASPAAGPRRWSSVVSWRGRLCCLMWAACQLASCYEYPAGLTRTIAGSSNPGFEDGPGTKARFASIQSVAWSPLANALVVIDQSNAIRRIEIGSGATSSLSGRNSEGQVADGVGGTAQFNDPKHVHITPDASTAWIWSADGWLRNISVATGQVPATPRSCTPSTLEECTAYAAEHAPWVLPLAETESCDAPVGCLRDGIGAATSVIFNTCPNTTSWCQHGLDGQSSPEPTTSTTSPAHTTSSTSPEPAISSTTPQPTTSSTSAATTPSSTPEPAIITTPNASAATNATSSQRRLLQQHSPRQVVCPEENTTFAASYRLWRAQAQCNSPVVNLGNFTWPAQCARKAVSQDCVRFQHASAQPHLGCWCCTWADSADTMVRSVYDVYDVVPTSVYSTSVCAGGMVSPWPSQYPDMFWGDDDNANMRFIERGSVVFERSTWRFAAGFEGNEDLLTWYRDPQYRSEAAGIGVGIVGNRIFKFSLSHPEGTFETLAGFWGGSHENRGYEDGVGTNALFRLSHDDSDLAVTARGNAVIVADTGNHCLRRIEISTAETSSIAGKCGSTFETDIKDGIGSGAKIYAPQRLIPVPPKSDGRDSPERELMIILPETLPFLFSDTESEIYKQVVAKYRTIRLVDIGSGQVWSLQSEFRDMISPILIGNVLVLADVYSLKAIVVRDHCRHHASFVGSACLCDPGWQDSPSVLDTTSLVWNTSSPRPHACVACAPGKFKAGAAGMCEPCPPGTSSVEASTECKQEEQPEQPSPPPPTASPPTTSNPSIELEETSSTVNITGDFFVTFIVTMPYSRSDFDAAKQEKYKAAIASVAATSADNVEIISITDGRRRQAGSVDVDTKILLSNANETRQMLKRLGEGEDLLDQINTELKAQNLQASTAVSAPQAVGLEQQRACPDLSLLFFAIPADFAGPCLPTNLLLGLLIGAVVIVCCCCTSSYCYVRHTRLKRRAAAGNIDDGSNNVASTLEAEGGGGAGAGAGGAGGTRGAGEAGGAGGAGGGSPDTPPQRQLPPQRPLPPPRPLPSRPGSKGRDDQGATQGGTSDAGESAGGERVADSIKSNLEQEAPKRRPPPVPPPKPAHMLRHACQTPQDAGSGAGHEAGLADAGEGAPAGAGGGAAVPVEDWQPFEGEAHGHAGGGAAVPVEDWQPFGGEAQGHGDSECAGGQTATAHSHAAADAGEDWRPVVHKETGSTYYWNTKTNDTSWARPAALAEGGHASAGADSSDSTRDVAGGHGSGAVGSAVPGRKSCDDNSGAPGAGAKVRVDGGDSAAMDDTAAPAIVVSHPCTAQAGAPRPVEVESTVSSTFARNPFADV